MSRTAPLVAVLIALTLTFAGGPAAAQSPTMVDRKLIALPWVEGLTLPIGMAFIAPNDMLVLEKNSGRVLRVTFGQVRGTVLDLAVNFASERGLLGIALHPDFPDDPGVYLYWTCRTATAPENPFFPLATDCPGPPALGEDTDDVLQAPLLGNRVDRFRWDGTSLVFEQNLITLRAFQNDGGPTPPDQGDEGQIARGNHDAGVIRFGPDGKLYVIVGDVGRRGQLQNLPSGPTATGLGPVVADDQFGGPQPDNAHFTGVILRLDDDGSTPTDNPFFAAGAAIGGEVGANIQRIYAYGIRNSFGMAFDPIGGGLWYQDNGEDAFDELNRVEAGDNLGWIQTMGPLARVPEYRAIETTSLHAETFPNLQQLRWGPERIATTSAEAASRLFALPGSQYRDPEFSWKHVVAPAGIGFVRDKGLGPHYEGDLIVGLSVPLPLGGPLLRFDLTRDRRGIAAGAPGLADGVDDNADFNTLTESAPLVIGENFGVVTEIQTGPDGHLYVVSLTNGAIYVVMPNKRPKKKDFPVAAAREAGVEAASSRAPEVRSLAPTVSGPMVRFALAEPATIRLTVHDVTGRMVEQLADHAAGAGEGSIRWNAGTLPQGVYFLRLETIGPDGGRAVHTSRAAVVR